MKQDIAAAQLRAARALVDWSREELAAKANTTSRTVARFESGETSPRTITLSAIRTALESAGVEFIEENGGGPGVRLRKGGAPHTTDPATGLRSVGPESEVRGGPEAAEKPEVETDD